MQHVSSRAALTALRRPLTEAPKAYAACIVSLACLWPATGMAQHHPVQRCTVDGAVVFQSAPCLRVATGAAPAAPAGARKAEGATKRRSLADTLRDHDAADRPLPPARPLTADGDGDGAMVLPERMGAR